MTTYHQAPPFSVSVELTEGCSTMCPFCAIRSIRKKVGVYRFMSVKTGRTLAEKLLEARAQDNWRSPRIEFNMRGEPTENAHGPEIIAGLRAASPKSYMNMCTNGSGLLSNPAKRVKEYWEAGLNTIAIEDYRHLKHCEKIRKALDKAGVPYSWYPQDKEACPHTRTRPDVHRVVIISALTETKTGTHSLVNTHGGGLAFPPDYSRIKQRCTFPFRDFSVHFDGNVFICCNDWRGVYLCGNIEEGLERVWQSPAFFAARQKLYHNQRDFKPCLGCSWRSFRVGLLPDPLGKETLPKPNKKTEQLMNAARDHEPLVDVVKREWEK